MAEGTTGLDGGGISVVRETDANLNANIAKATAAHRLPSRMRLSAFMDLVEPAPLNARPDAMNRHSISLDRTPTLIQGLERHVKTPQPAQMFERLLGLFGVQRPAVVALMV